MPMISRELRLQLHSNFAPFFRPQSFRVLRRPRLAPYGREVNRHAGIQQGHQIEVSDLGSSGFVESRAAQGKLDVFHVAGGD